MEEALKSSLQQRTLRRIQPAWQCLPTCTQRLQCLSVRQGQRTHFLSVRKHQLSSPSRGAGPRRRLYPSAATKAPQRQKASSSPQDPSTSNESSTAYIAASIAAAVATGVANRVLYKLALVPMGDYVFVLSQFQTFGYCLVYFGFLFARSRSGEVTQEMLDATDKRLFVGIGGLEAASQLLGFIGASKLPGVALPLLQQSIIIFQLVLSGLVLGKRLQPSQIIGALIVVAGVCTAAFPSKSGASIFAEADPVYIAVFVSSMLFPALASIIKEKIFTEGKEKLNGQSLDIFVVNSFGSGAQAVAVLLLLPVLVSLRGLSLNELPQYVSDGVSCFSGVTPGGGNGCDGAPLLPVAYVSMNLLYNIALLNLLRSAGAVVQSLTNSSLTPLTIFAFTFPLPYLADKAEFSLQLLGGTLILAAGLLTYNSGKWRPWLDEQLNKDR